MKAFWSFVLIVLQFTAMMSCVLAIPAASDGLSSENLRPIIGILAQTTGLRPISKYGRSYIGASYVKFVESGGARVVPILVNQPEDYYRRMFNSINGVIFPGGGVKVFSNQTGAIRSAAFMYSYAKESFDKGDYFPIYGICFGFEILAMLRDSFSCLTKNLSASDISLPLHFTPGYESSRMFGEHSTPPEIIEILSKQNVTFNAHRKGVTKKTFYSNPKLNTFFQDLSTNQDKHGEEFISSMEAYKYPIYGTQWHPEKVPFEWNTQTEKNIPHSADAIKISQYMADFIVSEARKNTHRFRNEEEEDKALIYQYQPIYTGDIYIMEQCYIFK